MITIKGLRKSFGRAEVLRGIDLSVAESEVVVIIGPSGSGKSTLLRCINYLEEPTAGSVEIDGTILRHDASINKIRAEVGMVFQRFNLFPHMTVLENIMLAPIKVRHQIHSEAEKVARLFLDKVGLGDRGSAYPAQLSGGQRQRVGVARALANDPKVLLMDEPFGALDPLVRADLQRELRDLQRRLGTTILFVTHDVDEAFLLGDQVAVLRTGGVLAQVGTPEELLSKPADEFVADFVGADASRRQLRSVERNGSRVVVDADGRPLGTLREDGGGAADGESS